MAIVPPEKKKLTWQFLARFGLRMNYAHHRKKTYFSKKRLSKSFMKISYALEPNISKKEFGKKNTGILSWITLKQRLLTITVCSTCMMWTIALGLRNQFCKAFKMLKISTLRDIDDALSGTS